MPAASKYPAIKVAIPSRHCEAVAALEGKRMLASKAPKLPLANCSMPDRCRCRFQKYSDRREDEQGRRFPYGHEGAAWYSGGQRRKSPGRRDKD